MIPQIDFEADGPVRAAITAVGRTEDLRFSPDNRLLAIAGYITNQCLILRIDVEQAPDGPRVTASDFMVLTSDCMESVHGLDFIDDRTMVIANRDGVVTIIQMPSGALGGRHCHVDMVRDVRGNMFGRAKTPGSVTTRREANGKVSLFVCNNYKDRVTRHTLNPRFGFRASRNRVLLKRGLTIPDGIALSNDGRWIAVSSHGTHDIKIYEASARLGPDTAPVGILQNANYPHGLRFSPGDEHILVADAGGPVIRIYDRANDWHGTHEPARSITVLDDDTFMRGRINPMDGGPKGLDIDRSNCVVAVTCDQVPLAFYSLEAMLTGGQSQPELSRRAMPGGQAAV